MLLELSDQSLLKEMRLKQVLMMMIGYAVSEIRHLLARKQGSNSNNKTVLFNSQIRQFQISQLVKQLTTSIINNPFITKLYLTQLFPTVLQILYDHIQTQITNDNIYTIFKLLIVEGLKEQHFEKDILITILIKALHQNIYPNLQIMQQNKKKFQQNQQQSSRNIQQSQQSMGVCDICMCAYSSNSPYKNNLKSSFTLAKCKHQFHHNCLFNMIKQHISTSNDILFFQQTVEDDKKVYNKQSTLIKQQQITTKIKCPHFQSCNVYFNLEEIHQLIRDLNDDQEQGQSIQQEKYLLLDKIYQLTFNQYLVNKRAKTFYQLKQDMLEDKDRQKDEDSSIMFYCNTVGCNAVYQISQDEIEGDTKLPNKSNNFICLSCKSSYCLKCFSTIHPTMSCKQHLISTTTLPQDEQLQKFIKTLKKPYKKCPKCKFYVDNWRGCSTVKCRCGIQFCFKCGNIGCPHAKCLREIQKEEKEKLKLHQKQRQIDNKQKKDKERI